MPMITLQNSCSRALAMLVRCLCLLVLALGAGCVHLYQELAIKDAETGSFKIHLSVPLQFYRGAIENPAGAVWPELARYFDPFAGAELFSEDDGFDVHKYRVFATETSKRLLIEGKITDLAKALETGRLGDLRLTDNPGGGKLLTVGFGPARQGGKKRAPTPQAREDIRAAAKGLKLSLVIGVPGKVLRTSAPLRKDDVVQWVFDAEKDDAFLFAEPEVFVAYE